MTTPCVSVFRPGHSRAWAASRGEPGGRTSPCRPTGARGRYFGVVGSASREPGRADHGVMKPPSYSDAQLVPLSTDALVQQRVLDLIGRAIRRHLWMLFLDADN